MCVVNSYGLERDLLEPKGRQPWASVVMVRGTPGCMFLYESGGFRRGRTGSNRRSVEKGNDPLSLVREQ